MNCIVYKHLYKIFLIASFSVLNINISANICSSLLEFNPSVKIIKLGIRNTQSGTNFYVFESPKGEFTRENGERFNFDPKLHKVLTGISKLIPREYYDLTSSHVLLFDKRERSPDGSFKLATHGPITKSGKELNLLKAINVLANGEIKEFLQKFVIENFDPFRILTKPGHRVVRKPEDVNSLAGQFALAANGNTYAQNSIRQTANKTNEKGNKDLFLLNIVTNQKGQAIWLEVWEGHHRLAAFAISSATWKDLFQFHDPLPIFINGIDPTGEISKSMNSPVAGFNFNTTHTDSWSLYSTDKKGTVKPNRRFKVNNFKNLYEMGSRFTVFDMLVSMGFKESKPEENSNYEKVLVKFISSEKELSDTLKNDADKASEYRDYILILTPEFYESQNINQLVSRISKTPFNLYIVNLRPELDFFINEGHENYLARFKDTVIYRLKQYYASNNVGEVN